MSLTAFGVFNGYAPEAGPKAMPVTLDFTTLGKISFDLLLEQTEGQQDFIQGVYVDNSANPNALTFIFGITNQKIVVPALSQGTYPVLAPDQVTVSISTTPGAGVVCSAIFLNVPTAYTQWGPITVNTGAITVSATPLIKPTVNASGSVAAGGTPQALFAANAARARMFVQNKTNSAEIVTLAFASGATIDLLPGEIFDSGGGPVSGEAVTIVSATIGTAFNAWSQ